MMKLAFTCPSGFSSPRQTPLAGASTSCRDCGMASLKLLSIGVFSSPASIREPASNANRCAWGCAGASVKANGSADDPAYGSIEGKKARGGAIGAAAAAVAVSGRSEEHTSELQSRGHLVCRLLLEKKKK